ncbi:hypothetical protein Tco_1339447, partial [Tanacetum coccineum]
DKDVNLSVDEVTLAQALPALKSTKVQEKEDVIKEPSVLVSAASTKQEQEQAPTPIVFSQQPTHVKDKGKGKMVEEELVKKISKKELLKLDEELLSSYMLKKMKKKGLSRKKLKKLKKPTLLRMIFKLNSKKAEAETAQESSSKRAGEALEQESSKKQKMDDDKETEELKHCMEIISDDVTIEATPLSTKSPTTVDYKIYKEGKKSYF